MHKRVIYATSKDRRPPWLYSPLFELYFLCEPLFSSPFSCNFFLFLSCTGGFTITSILLRLCIMCVFNKVAAASTSTLESQNYHTQSKKDKYAILGLNSNPVNRVIHRLTYEKGKKK